jgi:ribosomal protein S18 acetylase RimI-like enzyme
MSGQRAFTLDYLEHVVLRDGTRMQVRLLRPDDKEAVRAGFARLSPESRYARFLATKLSLSDAELRYLCEVDHEDHLAIGAALDGPEDAPTAGAALARFVRLSDSHDTAEAAIVVADDFQRRGLGKLLFLRLIAAGIERGIQHFRCEVLASNTGMAAMLAQISPERTVATSQGVMTIELSSASFKIDAA